MFLTHYHFDPLNCGPFASESFILFAYYKDSLIHLSQHFLGHIVSCKRWINAQTQQNKQGYLLFPQRSESILL